MTDPYRADWMDRPVWDPPEKPPTNLADPDHPWIHDHDALDYEPEKQ